MLINTSASFPKTLKTLPAAPSTPGEITPGFLMGVDEMIVKRPKLYDTLAQMNLVSGSLSTPCLVVKPEQVADVFDDKTLDNIKTFAGYVAKEIHPYLKAGIDTLWIVYRANKLRKDWSKPDRDIGDCLFEAAGLTLSTISVVGNVYPDLKVPERWSTEINFFVKSGKAVYQGKTIPNELLLSRDKQNEIPLKLMKLLGISLDPEFPDVTAIPLSQPKEKREDSVWSKIKSG